MSDPTRDALEGLVWAVKIWSENPNTRCRCSINTSLSVAQNLAQRCAIHKKLPAAVVALAAPESDEVREAARQARAEVVQCAVEAGCVEIEICLGCGKEDCGGCPAGTAKRLRNVRAEKAEARAPADAPDGPCGTCGGSGEVDAHDEADAVLGGTGAKPCPECRGGAEAKGHMRLIVAVDWATMRCPCGQELCSRFESDAAWQKFKEDHVAHTSGYVTESVTARAQAWGNADPNLRRLLPDPEGAE